MSFTINQRITFAEEPNSPYTVRAIGPRFAILTRSMTEEDRERYEYEGSIDKIMIYSIVDLKTRRRGPHNLVFNPYDFKTTVGITECLRDLEAGEIELSHRYMIPVLRLTGREPWRIPRDCSASRS